MKFKSSNPPQEYFFFSLFTHFFSQWIRLPLLPKNSLEIPSRHNIPRKYCYYHKHCNRMCEVSHLKMFTHACSFGKHCRHLKNTPEDEEQGEDHFRYFTHPNTDKTWNGIEYPQEWETQKSEVEVFEVDPHSDEYADICAQLKDSGLNLELRFKSIKRVQHKVLWQKYLLEKERMKKSNDGQCNERILYYGSLPQNAEKIASRGFDWKSLNTGSSGNHFCTSAFVADRDYVVASHDNVKKVTRIFQEFSHSISDYYCTRLRWTFHKNTPPWSPPRSSPTANWRNFRFHLRQ